MKCSIARRTLPLMIFTLLLVLFAGSGQADELRRRGMMGIQPAPGSGKGVLLGGVLPAMPAEKAGLKAGDRIVKINEHDVRDMPDFMNYMRKFYGGDTVTFTIERDDATLTKNLTLEPRPRETSEEYDVIYDHVSVKGLKLRTYITRPNGEGKHAAVLFMPSPLPQPMEFPPQLSQHPYKLLIASLTKAGYVTMRVDRAAVGDSEGDDPLKTDYAMDVETFRNAIKRLGKYEFVDGGQVYLLSMGLGSALAPTVAEGSPLKGVMTYGCTVVRPWHQCIPEMMRRMWDLETVESGEIDKRAKSLEGFLKQCSKPGSQPAEVVKDFPELAAIQAGIFPSADNMLGMPLHYYQDIAKQDLQATWGRVSVPVLSMWGNADFQANRRDCELIAETVNAKHKNAAEFRVLEGVDHGLNEADDMEDSYLSGNSGGEHSDAVAQAVIGWLKEKTKKAS